MSKIVKLKRLNAETDFDSLLTEPLENFPYSRGLQNSSLQFSYFLGFNSRYLFYTVKTPPSCNYDKLLKSGEFKADLWRQDVVELFIAENNTNHDANSQYQEFNFAPSGAYWCAFFNGYRKIVSQSEKSLAGLEIDRKEAEDHLRLSIKIPLEGMIIKDNFLESTRISCSAIWNLNPKLYFSTSSIDLDKPDFHAIGSWSKIMII